MRRRSPFNGLWVLFVILFMLGSDSGALMLFAITAMVIYFMVKALQSGQQNNASSATSSTPFWRKKTPDYTAGSQSRADIARVNVYLRKYFQSNRKIDMPNDIVLVLRDPEYKSLYSLDVYRGDTRVSTLAEFRDQYADHYAQLFDTLLSMAINDQKESATVVDAEFTPKTDTAQTAASAPEDVPEKRALYFANVLNDLNDDIPDQAISDGLYKSTALLKQIDVMETKFPDNKAKLDKLYQYYLPIQVRILKQYDKLQNVKSDPSYESTVTNLKKTINLVNQAMEQLIADMSDNDFINLSADISTLEAVLQKDGLAKDTSLNAGSALEMPQPETEKKQ